MNTRMGTSMGRRIDPNLIFQYVAGLNDAIVRDNVSATNFAQTYAGTNRTRINSAGVLEAVAANTPVIDYVNGVPMLRLEPAGTNLLFNSNTFTAAAGWTLSNVTGPATPDELGPDGTLSAWRMRDESASFGTLTKTILKSKSDSTTIFQVSISVPKTTGATTFPALGIYFNTILGKVVYFTINTNTGVLTEYSGNSATGRGSSIKSEGGFWRVSVWGTDNGANDNVTYNFYSAVNADASATWDVATQGSCVIANAKLTTGSIPSSYFAGAAAIGSELIAAQADRDFSGASNWANVDINAYDETGDLTITANAAGQYCQLPEAAAPMTVGKVYRITFAVANYVGGWTIGDFDGNVIGTVGANDTYNFYWICTNTGGGLRITSTAVNSSGDLDNFSIKEHGTVRISEANTVTLAMPAAVTAALAATGTLVVDWMPAFNRAAGVVTGIVSFDGNTASGLYTTTTAGNLSSNDGTVVAESTAAYTKNVLHRLVTKWPSSTDKYKVGASVAMAGVAYGSEAAYDGAITAGANIVLAPAIHGTMWFKSIKIHNKLITDAQINGM